jgi:hypothetical protein
VVAAMDRWFEIEGAKTQVANNCDKLAR